MTARYEDAGRFRRLVRWSAATRPLSWFYARTLHHIDRVAYRLTRGRATFASWVSGLEVVMLTTTGARSGRQITSPERERFMQLAGEVSPGFSAYAGRAAPRRIAVFRLRAIPPGGI